MTIVGFDMDISAMSAALEDALITARAQRHNMSDLGLRKDPEKASCGWSFQIR
jgi:hypothetical protein